LGSWCRVHRFSVFYLLINIVVECVCCHTSGSNVPTQSCEYMCVCETECNGKQMVPSFLKQAFLRVPFLLAKKGTTSRDSILFGQMDCESQT